MRRRFSAAVLVAVVALAGCHSRYISATVTNRTNSPISPFEVDYPSASFGAESLAPGATYAYRFKVLGSGLTAVLWTDAAHRDHKASGPELHEGDEGSLVIAIGANGTPDWQLNLVNRK